MEENEAPELFEELDAMALHYMAVVTAWRDKAPRAPNRMLPWAVSRTNVAELHACLTSTAYVSGAEEPPRPQNIQDEQEWKRLYRHCHCKRLGIFGESHLDEHREAVLNWPYRRDAYTALYGTAAKSMHIDMMDIVSKIFMAEETQDAAWIFSAEGTATAPVGLHDLRQELQDAYWNPCGASRVEKVENVLRQSAFDALNFTDKTLYNKLCQVLTSLEGRRRAERLPSACDRA